MDLYQYLFLAEEVIGEPERVTAKGDTKQADERLMEKIKELRSSRFRSTFLKRLSKLEVKHESVRKDWHSRLSHIDAIHLTENMEAHHVDLVSAGGARHAGNLVLLCKFHHNNYGPRLTRSMVTSALQDNSKKKVISYGNSHDDKTKVRGRSIKITISDMSEEVELFFTDQHTKWWIDNV